MFFDGKGGAAEGPPQVSAVVEREVRLARSCAAFAAGLALLHQEEAPPLPISAGDPVQLGWIFEQVPQELRVSALPQEACDAHHREQVHGFGQGSPYKDAADSR